MTKQTNRETARNELIRLLKGLDFYRSWVISSIKRNTGTITEENLNEIVMPGSMFLEFFDMAKGRHSTTILKEVQQWYSHTSGDLSYFANMGDEAIAAEINQFLNDFKREVGFDFHAEAGLLRKTVRTVLKRRKIANEEEYYMLKELEDDVSQSVIGSEELAKISDLLHEFGERKRPS